MSTPNDPYNQQPDPNQYPGQQPYGQQPDPNQYPGQQQPFAGQPYPGQPYPGQPAPVGPNGERLNDPDNTLGIVGLVLVFVCGGIVGLIVSWIALNKSKQRGYKNTPALIGVILGAIGTVLLVLWLILGVALAASGSSTSYLLV